MLQQGSLVWVEVVDPNGLNRKCRPALVVSPNPNADPENIVAVAVTSTFTKPLPETHVALPWDPCGNSRSGLKRECYAVSNWIVRFSSVEVRQEGGFVGDQALKRVLSKLPIVTD